MELPIAIALIAFMGYLLYDEFGGKTTPMTTRNRLGDYYAPGSVFEPVSTALARGVRLMEVHIYSDEQDHPVVALNPNGPEVENVSFESVMVDIVNDAFPSKDPFILSIFSHTDKSVTLNEVAEHITTIARYKLCPCKDIVEKSLDTLADKLLIVSGGNINGTVLESIVNLNWNNFNLRRLTHQQALHPRDPKELEQYNKFNLTLVGPEVGLKTITENPGKPRRLGCQWNLMDREGSGFSLVR